ncbi:hypothetical protein [Vibrio mediterranei]|uniref:hypothetical protein n=1 Tax=Vibrio mediterranei TaxID=689 RepID=UPI00148C3808|nr:hypothetical protein [Vibrio mediterranei]NOH31701.1 hypothetical protein [Vibrio mediterranei]
MAKLAIALGLIAALLGLYLCFDSLLGYFNGALMWDFFAVIGSCLIPFGAYIAVVNYRIMREDTN